MSPKKLRKISHPEQEIFLYWPYLSKEASQLTHKQTSMKLVTIWEQCKNIPGMSTKIFRKIFHPEQEKSLHLCNFSKKVSQLRD